MRNTKATIQKLAVAIIATAVVALAMLWLSGTFRSGTIEPGKVARDKKLPEGAKSAAVTKSVGPREAEFIGSIQAERRATISARLVANIINVKVRAGDRVNKGDVLVELDDRDIKARVQQARDAEKAAQARADLAKVELERVRQVVEQNAASKNELDVRNAEFATANAEVSRAHQLVSEAEVALSDTQIRSPFAGIVIDRQAEPGDQAAPGRTLLRMYDPSDLRLEAAVREAYIDHVKSGQSLKVIIDAGNQVRDGVVVDVVPSTESSSRSFIVRVTLKDPSNLYPGMFGRVRLPLEPAERLEIPTSALQQIGQLTQVQVVQDNTASVRAVRLGTTVGEKVEVLAGLSEGEQVLVK